MLRHSKKRKKHSCSSMAEIRFQMAMIQMNPSPTLRMSFWIIVIGHTVIWMNGIAVNQAMVQKFMALPTYKQARDALIFCCGGLLVTKSISCFTGLLIYSAYHDCDPLTTKVISRTDQLLPYYVMDISASVPGLPGLFVAGIFSASLSTMSSSLNSLGATLFEDFVRPCFKNKINDKTASNLIKGVVVVIGAICLAIVFIVDKLGSILQLSFSVSGITSGAMLGLFTFGMFYPRGNSKGALAGSITSLLFMTFVVFGNQKAIRDGSIKLPILPMSVDGCKYNVTLPQTVESTEEPVEEAFILFRVTFMYYTLMGLIIMFIVAVIVSHLTEAPNLDEMNSALFTPIIRKYVLDKRYNEKEPATHKLLQVVSTPQKTTSDVTKEEAQTD